ncbi:radical SAM protein [Thiovibrio sp. JS02]
MDAKEPGSHPVTHPRFGPLNRPDAVCLAGTEKAGHRFTEKNLSYIHLSITGRCNARCKGCINASITNTIVGDRSRTSPIRETVPERDAACILNLLAETTRGEAVICFYGGEPLLATEKMGRVKAILDAAPKPVPLRYLLYTNGDLLAREVAQYPQFFRDLWLTSVSIDGTTAQHETMRPGTRLPRIHEGLKALRTVAQGKILMWSTLREAQSLSDCVEEFLALNEQGLADLFFWHWVETAEPYQNFSSYCDRYERDLDAVMQHYLSWLGQGRILPALHLNELIAFALCGHRRNSSGCGVELAENFDLIDGKIHSCADLPPDLAIGHIEPDGTPRFRPHNLMALVEYKKHLGCNDCGVHAYCGGRCPVQAQISGTTRLRQYCQLMRLHVGVALEYLDQIREEMIRQGLSAQNLYDAAGFYAQFTDVTP